MKAVVIHAPKDLRIEEHDVPSPGAGEVEIAVGAGGICGSDLHYYNHGGFGVVRVQEPMILGHEVAGTVAAVGAGVTGVAPGMRVAVNPSRPCGVCEYCRRGLQNHCLDMRFYGSAMRMPHIQGAFRQRLVADAAQCVPVADGVSLGEAAMAEPFAVALHAVARAGTMLGARVLVTGFGPIGALVAVAARHHGAREVVVTDVVDAPLALAPGLGVDRALNVAADAEALKPWAVDKGRFDVLFEASGNERAIAAGMDVLRPRGVLVQVGLGGATASLPLNAVVAGEIDLRGTFRFHTEFELAVDLIGRRRVDLAPLLTGTYGIDEAVAAFEAANDRTRSMKVQLAV
jgi:L-idonate 5-dehydrogenase